MCSAFIFSCIMTMISNFLIFFIFQIFIYKYDRLLFCKTCFFFGNNFVLFLKKTLSALHAVLRIHNFFDTIFAYIYIILILILVNENIVDVLYRYYKYLTEYAYLLLLSILFQDYFYIYQSFLL